MSSENPLGPNPGDIISVEIEKMAIGGRGVARHNGFVVFLEGAAPGDFVQAQITSRKAQFAEGFVAKVLRPGPGRRTPPCPHAGLCGGCNWQHLNEETQLKQKYLFVEESLRKFLPQSSMTIFPILPSPRSLHYRNRVQPRLQDGKLGYHQRGSHLFLPVDDCLLVEEALQKYFKNPELLKNEPFLQENGRVEIRMDIDKTTAGFSQVNRFQNEEIVSLTTRWVSEWQGPEIWDLYAGSGNFTFPLNDQFKKIPLWGIEGDSGLAQIAQQRIDNEGRRQMRFACSDVGAFLRRNLPGQNSLIFLDPPRAGAESFVMRALAASGASDIVYISCHPISLARDLKTFMEARPGAYKIAAVQPFEMFPQTDHVETAVHLIIDRS